ncbi:MAG TPA: hypothetical protein ENN05_10705 [Deltaproteobacteria bacterium]|nr:hypothetical protein [Deltaproteobacteria bacterium]
MRFHSNPALLEVNMITCLEDLKREYGEQTTWSSIPDEYWTRLAGKGYSLLWLMGIWERSPGSRMCALSEQGLLREYGHALPGWNKADVAGSPYAVHAYNPDSAFGTEKDLAALKKNLNNAGIGLILDFVPNHLALDHPWTLSNPNFFVRAAKEEHEKNPHMFITTQNGDILAHGKDPYFPPWKDTVQINYFMPEARKAMIDILMEIARHADGVRCDMAMLVLNSVFEKTWGCLLEEKSRPEREFWSEAIQKVKEHHPDFIFIAEAYWDLEWKLQQLGFDYTYDKKLYDLVLNAFPGQIHDHLKAGHDYQRRSVRFIENHDEPRAAAAFGRKKSMAAAVVAATVPGMHLFHEGQDLGTSRRLPVQLKRRLQENPDHEIQVFYDTLLNYINHGLMHSGRWELMNPAPAWEENLTYHNLLSWVWHQENMFRLIVINYSEEHSQGRVYLPKNLIQEDTMVFHECLTDAFYARKASDLIRYGLYLDLYPWQTHLFEIASP